MKKSIFILIMATLFFALKAFAQQPTNANNSDSTEHYLLDFSVPDMPAFKALGTDPSDILRPSDIQKFAAQLSPFYSGGKTIIPQNFSLEYAPWKLASKRWTLERYNRPLYTWLYNSAFSLGTLRDTSSLNSKLSIGYRFTIISRKGDILKSAKISRKIYNSMAAYQAALLQLSTTWVVKIKNMAGLSAVTYRNTHKAEFLEFLAGPVKQAAQNDAQIANDYNAFLQLLAVDSLKVADFTSDTIFAGSLNQHLDELIAKFKAEQWNAGRTDFAAAYVAASSDTLLANAQFSSFSVWITQSIAIHKNGQLLVGINARAPRVEHISDSVSRRIDFAGNFRYYLGTSDVRGFVEAQYKYRNIDSLSQSLLFNLGAEFRLSGSFWVIANAGINNYLGESKPLNKIVSSINIRYAFNKPNK